MARGILDIDLTLLQTLDALLQDQNVTHAASRLNISQSALSARLARLRDLLNDPLFLPAASGRGMIPTAHAIAIGPELARLLARFEDFLNTAHLFDPAKSKRVFRLAATDNPAAILAPDLVRLMREQAPLARTAFLQPNRAKNAEQLEKGEIDIVVGGLAEAAPELIGQPLFEEEFMMAQRKGHPRGTSAITLDEFCELDHLLVSSSGGNFSGMVDDALAGLGRERRVTVSIQSYALAPVVLAGTDCVCTLPTRFLERFKDTLDFYQPPLPLRLFSMNIFWHPRMRSDPAHKWFRNLVLQVGKSK